MFGLIFLLLIVVPALELYVLFQVADGIGWLPSIVLLVAISAIGGTLMKWQTSGAFGRIAQTLSRGELPSKELADGALMIFGGALLLTPGFFTDAVGLALFIPPIRALVRRLVLKRFSTKLTNLGGSGSTKGFTFTTSSGGSRFRPFIDVDVVRADRIPNKELPADE